ncbi:MAG: uracil-DNA glycosylase [Proteobacteria bacterium]|nr:uracil-DNA glycosylase [Pseudomonadota bacterium]
MSLNLDSVDSSWVPLITTALETVDPLYLESLNKNNQWLPGKDKIFAAFSLPISETRYILFGESPYPRAASANGYAFWDGAVDELWSETGLSVPVNRATSLRNWIKMLLIAEGALDPSDTSQTAIANLDKSNKVKTIQEFFNNLLNHGVLLLNASLVLSEEQVRKDAAAWKPFMQSLLNQIWAINSNIQLILFGKIAETIQKLDIPSFKQFVTEHPYNISFIHNEKALDFFRPLKLLGK